MKKILAALLLFTTIMPAAAQGWLDTSAPDKLLNLGVRLGINSANTTCNPTDWRDGATLDSWGTGMQAGIVAGLHFNNAFGIQPGILFQSRSHNYSYVYAPQELGLPNKHEFGHTRSTAFQIPVLAVVTLTPAENFRWAFEFGPYFNFGLGGSDKGTEEIGDAIRTYKDGYYDARHKFMFGFKMGTTLQIFHHYSLGIHYEAGAGHVWKNGRDGRAKCWSFTLGYDF